MGDQMEHAGQPAADPQGKHHVAELTDGRVGQDPLDVGCGDGNGRSDQERDTADVGNRQKDFGDKERVEAPDQVDARGHHGCRMHQRGDRRGPFHGIRQPDVQWKLGALANASAEDTEPGQWEVSSLVIPGLAVQVSAEPFENAMLLTRRLYPEEDAGSNFWEPFEAAVQKLIARREAVGSKKPGYLASKRVDLDETQERGAYVAALSLTAAGKKSFLQIRTLTELKKQLSGIRFLPSGGYAAWQTRYAPEAVFTQAWGTESDFARMAEVVLSRQGLGVVRTEVDLTEKGRQALAKMAGLETCSKETLPALRYRDEQGTPRLLVTPFLEDLSKLKELGII